MHTQLLRALLLEYLKAVQNQPHLDFRSCLQGVSQLAEQRCRDQLLQIQPGRFDLPEEDGSRLKHVIWDLIIGRVLIPGTKSPNTISGDVWPNLSLTEHGRKVVAEAGPVPYDPDGYLARLDQATGGLSPTVKRYLEESLSTFRTNNLLAAAVMLGATSEMVFLELCSVVAKAIASAGDRKTFEDRTGPRKNMSDRLVAVKDWLNLKKAQLPSGWQRQEQIGLVDKIADLIRNRRNDAGHPQDPPAAMHNEEMYALLVVFPHYCQKLYELKNWLAQRPGTIT
jgi:hypothetical protein